jgi:Protein of unknown function (DUF2800)
MSGTHARFAPSAFHLTVPCPGSVALQEKVPAQPETDEEAEGTAAHWIATEAASGRVHPIGHKFTLDGREWTVDLDMFGGARMFAHACGGAGGTLRVEEPVGMARFHPTDCWGRPDAFRYFASTQPGEPNVLRIPEYKYGHRFVEVFENLQMIGYAEGVIELLRLDDQNLTVQFIIVQPRAYHREGPVRMWKVAASELRPLMNKIIAAIDLAQQPDPPTETGTHCLDCKARANCKTLQYAVANVVDFSGSAEIVNLPHEAMGQELRILADARQRLEARYTGLAQQVESLMRNGMAVPFWKLEPGRANLAWKADTTVEEVAGLGELLGVELRKPAALITPTQATALGIDGAVISQYAERPTPGLSLKPDSTTAARKIFGANAT